VGGLPVTHLPFLAALFFRHATHFNLPHVQEISSFTTTFCPRLFTNISLILLKMDTQLDSTSLVTETDLKSAVNTISRIRTQALQILNLQNQSLATSTQANGVVASLTKAEAEKLKTEISTLQTQMYATNSRLRAQQRGAVRSMRATKAATSEARQEVDGLSLMLQNLVYEQRHFKGEIEACEDYKYVLGSIVEHALTDLPAIHIFPSH
jgi:hypothetical protein